MKHAITGLCMIIGLISVNGCDIIRGHRTGELDIAYWDQRAGAGQEARYDTKFTATVDGRLAGESGVGDRYDRKTLKLSLSPGPHTLIVEGYARKNGEWEKRTAAAGYAMDHYLEKKVTVSPAAPATVTFVVPDSADVIKINF